MSAAAPQFGTTERNEAWLNVKDSPGIIMATITWILMLYSCAGVLWVLDGMPDVYFIIFGTLYVLLTVLCLWSHMKTMLTDPGAVPRSARPLPSARDAGIPETICGRCDAYKPPRSHHCRICGRCVVRMDHHCPWMNNCIGAKNQKHFILFLVYAWAQCVFVLLLIVIRLSDCDESLKSCFPGSTGGVCVSLVTIGVLALLFVTSMLNNQVYAVLTGIGTIDRMKRRARHLHHMPLKWTDVFGDDFFLYWLVPTDPVFHDEDNNLGYTVLGNTWRLNGDENSARPAAGDEDAGAGTTSPLNASAEDLQEEDQVDATTPLASGMV